MTVLICSCAVLLNAVSALLLYCAVPRGRYARPMARRACASGAGFALAALVAWMLALGIGAGICAMLAGEMLMLAALPYLALTLAGTAHRHRVAAAATFDGLVTKGDAQRALGRTPSEHG